MRCVKMKISNPKISVMEYELFPQVVRKNQLTSFTLHGLGIECALDVCGTYIIRVIPQEQIITAKTLRIGDDEGYDEIIVRPDQNGILHFAYTFSREQIYTIRLLKLEGEEKRRVADLRVFAAEEDLWGRIPMRGNTHCHASPSDDGNEDPALAASYYRKAGYDYLAITDHHLIDGSAMAIAAYLDIPTELALYPGEEVHIPNAYLHIVNVGAQMESGLGIEAWYEAHKETVHKEVEQIAERDGENLPDGVEPYDWAWRKWIADTIHKNGGIAIIAHPFWEYDAHNTSNAMFEYLAKTKTFDAVEILHGQDAGCPDANMQVAFWNDLRVRGIFIPIVGCDDAHRRIYPWNYDSSFNKVYTIIFANEPGFSGFADAIRNGYSVAVDNYDQGPTIRVDGTYRLVKYAIFLLDQYFPHHDDLCFEEGVLMRRAYLGDETALQSLKQIHGRVACFRKRFFGQA